MNGFPLKTSKRTHFCEKCQQYYSNKKHLCKPNSAFVRVPPGTVEYEAVCQVFRKYDSGTWDQTLLLQAARIDGTLYYYIIILSFYKIYSALILGPTLCWKAKPRQGFVLTSVDSPSMLYVNDDYSAAIIPLNLFKAET